MLNKLKDFWVLMRWRSLFIIAWELGALSFSFGLSKFFIQVACMYAFCPYMPKLGIDLVTIGSIFASRVETGCESRTTPVGHKASLLVHSSWGLAGDFSSQGIIIGVLQT